MSTAGAAERDIAQQGITADYLQYQQEQQYPYQQLEFMQSMLQGLPVAARTQSYVAPGSFQDLSGASGGVMALLQSLIPGFGGQP
jgi:hypothetical protein